MNLKNFNDYVVMAPHTRLTIISSGVFAVYQVDPVVNSDGEITDHALLDILGPKSSASRRMVFRNRSEDNLTLYIQVMNSDVQWNYTVEPFGRRVCEGLRYNVNVGERRESTEEMVRRIVATQLSQQAVESGQESFDEANDFGPDADYDGFSPPGESIFTDIEEEEEEKVVNNEPPPVEVEEEVSEK